MSDALCGKCGVRCERLRRVGTLRLCSQCVRVVEAWKRARDAGDIEAPGVVGAPNTGPPK